MINVIIPTKTASNVLPCLRAIRRNQPHDTSLIVVDDGLSFDEQIEVHFEQAAIVPGLKPFIFARNVNRGIMMTGDTFDVTRHSEASGFPVGGYGDVVLMNDDALLQTPDGFTLLKDFADAHPEVGIVAPATNITGQRLQWPKFRTPEGFRFVDQLPFVCVYIPRRTLERVGLLDERYCLDYGVEDRDYCEAVTRAGMKIAIVYDVYVDHGSLRSSFRGDPKAPKSFQRNYALFKQKWGIR